MRCLCAHWAWPIGTLGQPRTLRDLPQIVLAAYFLKRSFGDCLIANKSVPVAEILSVVQNCQLTENAAFMVVMSLMTSAVYLGCAHRPHHLWSFRPETKLLSAPPPPAVQWVRGCADKIVQIPRVVDLWRERKELEDRRLLGQELLESAARFRATSANTDSGPRIVQVLEFSR